MLNVVFLRFALLALIFAAILVLNLCCGEVQLSLNELAEAISAMLRHAEPASVSAYQILADIRLPRALAAALVGAGLGVSGYLLQSLSNNGLADPYLTGVSSGSALAVVVAVIVGLDFALVPVLSLLGGIGASFVVLSLSRSRDGISINRLLLSGVAVSAFCSGVITMLICSGLGSARTQGIFYWLAGSVSGKSWSDLLCASIYILLGFLAALVLSKPIRVLSLGVETASSLGLSVAKTQLYALLAAILLCSASVSLSGIVGFAGLVAPYFARQIFGRDERVHILATALVGASLVLLSDYAARVVSASQEPPLGTLLSLIGGPFFIYLLLRNEDGAYRL